MKNFSSSIYQPSIFPNWEENPQPILLGSVNIMSVRSNSINDLELSDAPCLNLGKKSSNFCSNTEALN